MKARDAIDLLLLAALWGASFLFLRVAAPEFGPVALIEVRVVLTAVFLVPILMARSGTADLKTHWQPILMVGALNSALPFCLFAYSTLYLTGGFAAIINATSPLFGAIVAWLWLGDRLSSDRVVGLAIGFAGVVVLVWNEISFELAGAGLAVPAALLASALYGVAANYTKKYLSGVAPLALATGSQIGAAMLLLPAAVWLRPEAPVSLRAWLATVVLGIACTAIAYLLYFRLIANVGPARAISVTYLIPGFAVMWGAMFLHEALTLNMIIGCVIILLGTALATGMLKVLRSG